MLCVDEQRKRSKSRSKFACRSKLTTVSLYATHYWINQVYTIVAATVETYLRWNCQPTFSVSKSPDHVLSKAGLLSTKLSQTIMAWTLLFYKTDTKLPFYSSFSRNHGMVSTHARRGKRLRRCIAQSRDRATIVRNLGILRMRNAISRLRKFSDCAEHILFAYASTGSSTRSWII